MKALTVWQPWASLIAVNAKRYETRSWFTRYRGAIAIHAASRSIRETLRMLDYGAMQIMATALGLDAPEDLMQLATGCVIATAKLTGCHSITRHPNHEFPILRRKMSRNEMGIVTIEDPERLFGDYTPGRYAWELEKVKMLREPVVVAGHQGLWDWEEAA